MILEGVLANSLELSSKYILMLYLSFLFIEGCSSLWVLNLAYLCQFSHRQVWTQVASTIKSNRGICENDVS
jgi:hypothetical protein